MARIDRHDIERHLVDRYPDKHQATARTKQVEDVLISLGTAACFEHHVHAPTVGHRLDDLGEALLPDIDRRYRRIINEFL